MNHNDEYFRRLDRDLCSILNATRSSLPAVEVKDIESLLHGGEYGLALECVACSIRNASIRLDDTAADTLRSLAVRLKPDDEYARVIANLVRR
jgi:hypothetical protein